jgi:hypothetical protein
MAVTRCDLAIRLVPDHPHVDHLLGTLHAAQAQRCRLQRLAIWPIQYAE